jgi:DNA polymerase III subunit delta'
MAFSSIIGQKDAKERLVAALQGTPGHAYLFVGPDGIGKTLLAREFAKALLCQRPSADGACGVCSSCRYFEAGVNPDFCFLQPEDKDKVIKVERVRQSISQDLYIRPQFGQRKVYLIAGDALNEQGQNALLKSLEEPPEYAVFLLTVISPSRLLPTILSRTSSIVLRRYSPDEIEAILIRNGITGGPEMQFFARFAGGLAGLAIDLACSTWFSDLRQETLQFYRKLGRQSRTAMLTEGFQFFEANKARVPVMLDILDSLVRDQLVLASGGNSDLVTNHDQWPFLKSARPGGGVPAEVVRGHLAQAYAALLSARRGLSLNISFEPLICNLLLQLRKEFTYA